MNVWLLSTPVYLGQTTVEADGTFSFLALLPAGVAGQHYLVATGTADDGRERTVAQAITISSAPASDQLALTGRNSAALTVFAVLLVMCGLVVVLQARRRRT